MDQGDRATEGEIVNLARREGERERKREGELEIHSCYEKLHRSKLSYEIRRASFAAY